MRLNYRPLKVEQHCVLKWEICRLIVLAAFFKLLQQATTGWNCFLSIVPIFYLCDCDGSRSSFTVLLCHGIEACWVGTIISWIYNEKVCVITFCLMFFLQYVWLKLKSTALNAQWDTKHSMNLPGNIHLAINLVGL